MHDQKEKQQNYFSCRPQAAEETVHPNADNFKTFQTETSALPSADPGLGVFQETVRIFSHRYPRAHRIFQTL